MRVVLNGVDRTEDAQREALQREAVRRLADCFIDAVKEGGERGAPAGVLYAAVLGTISLAQFNQIMAALVKAGRLRKDGDLYFHVADGGIR
jgi:hypothetical protein